MLNSRVFIRGLIAYDSADLPTPSLPPTPFWLSRYLAIPLLFFHWKESLLVGSSMPTATYPSSFLNAFLFALLYQYDVSIAKGIIYWTAYWYVNAEELFIDIRLVFMPFTRHFVWAQLLLLLFVSSSFSRTLKFCPFLCSRVSATTSSAFRFMNDPLHNIQQGNHGLLCNQNSSI